MPSLLGPAPLCCPAEVPSPLFQVLQAMTGRDISLAFLMTPKVSSPSTAGGEGGHHPFTHASSYQRNDGASSPTHPQSWHTWAPSIRASWTVLSMGSVGSALLSAAAIEGGASTQPEGNLQPPALRIGTFFLSCPLVLVLYLLDKTQQQSDIVSLPQPLRNLGLQVLSITPASNKFFKCWLLLGWSLGLSRYYNIAFPFLS